jgi:glycosyltransferase involved in cell wall biosynthesis
MACGTPVVALKKGGAIETVIEGETGLFFRENSAESLKEALTKMKHHSFNPLRCRDQARHFRRERFENEILNALSAL